MVQCILYLPEEGSFGCFCGSPVFKTDESCIDIAGFGRSRYFSNPPRNSSWTARYGPSVYLAGIRPSLLLSHSSAILVTISPRKSFENWFSHLITLYPLTTRTRSFAKTIFRLLNGHSGGYLPLCIINIAFYRYLESMYSILFKSINRPRASNDIQSTL